MIEASADQCWRMAGYGVEELDKVRREALHLKGSCSVFRKTLHLSVLLHCAQTGIA